MDVGAPLWHTGVAHLAGSLRGTSCSSLVAPAWCLTRRFTQLVTLTDLENDFLNPIDCAARLNVLVKPEVALLAVQTAWLLLTGRLLLALLYGAFCASPARRGWLSQSLCFPLVPLVS